MKHVRLLAFVAGSMALNSPSAALAQKGALDCSVPSAVTRLNAALPHTARAIRKGKGLTIVALGSSSTEGIGASSEDLAYPARLAWELSQRWPKLPVRVINSGVRGETASEMLARLDRDVLAHKPDLVIWQAGSNTLLRQTDLKSFTESMRLGIRRLQKSGADVVLMNPQFAPRVVKEPAHRRLIEATHALANDFKVGLFRRFAVMRHWLSSGRYRMEDLISRDRLHMNDTSYGCIAKLLADGLSTAAREFRTQPEAAEGREDAPQASAGSAR